MMNNWRLNKDGMWSAAEHDRLLEARKQGIRKWRAIADHVGTRSQKQCISHWQKFRQKVEKMKAAGQLFDLLPARTEHCVPPEMLVEDLRLESQEGVHDVDHEDEEGALDFSGSDLTLGSISLQSVGSPIDVGETDWIFDLPIDVGETDWIFDLLDGSSDPIGPLEPPGSGWDV